MIIKENSVRTGNAILLWDGITRPQAGDDGALEWTVKVAVPETSPEYAELYQIVQSALLNSEFKGNLPPGGTLPFNPPDLDKFDSRLQGHVVFGAKTRLKVPEVFNAHGKPMSPMEYGSQIYAGCIVQVLVNAYAYNKMGHKGVALGLSGIMIVDSKQPAFAIAGGLSPQEVASAFGGSAAPAPVAAPLAPPAQVAVPPVPGAPAPPAPVAPNPSILTPDSRLTPAGKALGHPYSALIAAGWTDAMLVQQGYLTP